jgi:hypothetical protein
MLLHIYGLGYTKQQFEALKLSGEALGWFKRCDVCAYKTYAKRVTSLGLPRIFVRPHKIKIGAGDNAAESTVWSPHLDLDEVVERSTRRTHS